MVDNLNITERTSVWFSEEKENKLKIELATLAANLLVVTSATNSTQPLLRKMDNMTQAFGRGEGESVEMALLSISISSATASPPSSSASSLLCSFAVLIMCLFAPSLRSSWVSCLFSFCSPSLTCLQIAVVLRKGFKLVAYSRLFRKAVGQGQVSTREDGGYKGLAVRQKFLSGMDVTVGWMRQCGWLRKPRLLERSQIRRFLSGYLWLMGSFPSVTLGRAC